MANPERATRGDSIVVWLLGVLFGIPMLGYIAFRLFAKVFYEQGTSCSEGGDGIGMGIWVILGCIAVIIGVGRIRRRGDPNEGEGKHLDDRPGD